MSQRKSKNFQSMQVGLLAGFGVSLVLGVVLLNKIKTEVKQAPSRFAASAKDYLIDQLGI